MKEKTLIVSCCFPEPDKKKLEVFLNHTAVDDSGGSSSNSICLHTSKVRYHFNISFFFFPTAIALVGCFARGYLISNNKTVSLQKSLKGSHCKNYDVKGHSILLLTNVDLKQATFKRHLTNFLSCFRPAENFDWTFRSLGTVQYFCSVHT